MRNLVATPEPIENHGVVGDLHTVALVALDGSELAEAAVAPAAELVAALAAPAQGALHLVRVVDILPRYGTGKSQAGERHALG